MKCVRAWCSVVAAICVAMAAQAQLVLGSSIALPLLLDEHHHCSSAASLRLGCTQGLHRYSLSCQSSTKAKKRNGNGLQRRERKGTVCMALGDNNPSPAQPQVYQGIYGPWSVDSLDIREVGSVKNSVFGQRVHDSCAFLTIRFNCCGYDTSLTGGNFKFQGSYCARMYLSGLHLAIT